MKKKGLFAGGVIIGIIAVIAVVYFLFFRTVEHEYYCDNFLLTVDNKQIDLTTVDEKITAVVELLPVTENDLAVVCRVEETTNALMVYNFKKKDFVFHEYGEQMCWVQEKYDTLLYLKDNVVYDKENEVVYRAEEGTRITVIEYIGEDFYVTLTGDAYEYPTQIMVE